MECPCCGWASERCSLLTIFSESNFPSEVDTQVITHSIQFLSKDTPSFFSHWTGGHHGPHHVSLARYLLWPGTNPPDTCPCPLQCCTLHLSPYHTYTHTGPSSCHFRAFLANPSNQLLHPEGSLEVFSQCQSTRVLGNWLPRTALNK